MNSLSSLANNGLAKSFKHRLGIFHNTFCRSKVCVLKLLFRPNLKRRKINLGGGNWLRKHWENVDFYADPVYIDYKINLLKVQSLPFEIETVEKTFTSHLLEHLPDDAVLNLLKECKRRLKSGGVLRISVPDMDKAFEAYFQGNRAFFESNEIYLVGEHIERRLVNFFASYKIGNYSGGPIIDKDLVQEKIATLDRLSFVKWCKSLIPKEAEYIAHVNGFNYEKLACMLKDAGFVKVYKSLYRQSKDEEMRGKEFDNRPISSLFVEATK